MMHPFAGHAATASGTPRGKRSANRIFERSFTLAVPPALTGSPLLPLPMLLPSIAPIVLAEPREAADSTAVPVVLGTPVFAITVSVPDTGPDPILGVALTKAETGKPPKVCASAASRAYGTLASSTLGSSSLPGKSACTPNQRDSPEVN